MMQMHWLKDGGKGSVLDAWVMLPDWESLVYTVYICEPCSEVSEVFKIVEVPSQAIGRWSLSAPRELGFSG